MDSVSCPLPQPVDPQAALKKLQEIQQRRKSLSPAAQERMAAREMSTDISSFRAALKGKTVMPSAKEIVEEIAKNTEPIFKPNPRGGYSVDFIFSSGRKGKARVFKSSERNASARGGVERQGWEAKFGDYTGFGTTRTEALEKLAYQMRVKKTPITFGT